MGNPEAKAVTQAQVELLERIATTLEAIHGDLRNGPPDPVDPARAVVDAVRSVIQRLVQETSGFVDSQPRDPVDGSPAFADRMDAPRQESVDTAISIVWHFLGAIGEHGTLFCKALTPPIEVIASANCVRAMLEPSALIRWLLDPGIDARGRVGRVYALRRRELDQNRKLYEASGDVKTVRFYVERIREIAEQAEHLGYVVDRKGPNVTKIAESVPKATDAIRDSLGRETDYRLLSALAHTETLALRRWCYDVVESDGAGPTIAVKAFRPQNMALLGAIAAFALRDSLVSFAAYMGWEMNYLKWILDRAATEMVQIMENTVAGS